LLLLCPSHSTNTIELISSGFFPALSNNTIPTSDCKAANRKHGMLSVFKTKFTPPWHKLHTPSNSMTGRESVLEKASSSRRLFDGGDVDDDKDVLTALFFLFVFEVDDDDDDDESRELLLGFFITMCAALFFSVVQVACAARVAAASMTRSHSNVSLSLSF